MGGQTKYVIGAVVVIAIAIAAFFLLGGDSDESSTAIEETEIIAESTPQPLAAEIVEDTSADFRPPELDKVYFDFDKSDLTDETRRVLRQNADWLKANGEYAVVIEGHCDERGTIEYNLALGQRRAQAVQDYLVNLGISAERMRNKSFGEEQPADPGHDEAAWSRNRRAAFVIE